MSSTVVLSGNPQDRHTEQEMQLPRLPVPGPRVFPSKKLAFALAAQLRTSASERDKRDK